MRDVKDKVAVITGAASGIGRGMAESFVAAGMKVVLSDIESAALDETTRALRAAGGDVHPVRTGHPEHNGAVDQRVKTLLSGRNPTPPAPTPETVGLLQKLNALQSEQR